MQHCRQEFAEAPEVSGGNCDAGVPCSVPLLWQELQRDSCREAHSEVPGHCAQAFPPHGRQWYRSTSESAEVQALNFAQPYSRPHETLQGCSMVVAKVPSEDFYGTHSNSGVCLAKSNAVNSAN